MTNNLTSPDKLRELAPRLLSRKDIIARAKYGAYMGASANPEVRQWFAARETEAAQRRASELVMHAVQQPGPAELQTQQEVNELQAKRLETADATARDIWVAEARRGVEEARNTVIPPEVM